MSARRNIPSALGAIVIAVLVVCLSIGSAFAATTSTLVHSEQELRTAVGKGSAAGNITLANDIELNNTLNLGDCPTEAGGDRKVIIDLAGHELRPSATASTLNVISIPSGYELTVRDSSGKNTGSITGGARGIFNQGTFNLTTGGIRNNNSSNDGCGLYNDTGAIANITGGVIENNNASGSHDGAGVFNCGQLQMTGGIIQNNTTDTSNGRGGGIYNGHNGNLTLSSGTIKNNTAWCGGGVYNKPDCDVLVVMGRVKIQENAAAHDGGGIFNGETNDGVKLIVLGGNISKNTAGSTGGGIANQGKMAASGGAITGNTAKSQGGGICAQGEVTLSGNPIIKDNVGFGGIDNDVDLGAGKRILIEDAFSGRAQIGITTEDPSQVFTDGYATHNAGKDPSTIFFPNNNNEPFAPYITTDNGDYPGEALCVVIIHYLDEHGVQQNCEDYKDVKSKNDEWGSWGSTKWYAVRRSTDINEYVKVEGEVNLILCSGTTLKTGGIGILRDDKRAKLTIYNSVGDYGHLIADSDDWGDGHAGIGYKKNSGGVGSLVINGGDILARGGGDAAGIGGVENRGNGPITINGGRVVAYGGKWGAGIGGGQGGDQDNPIKINGGYVEAHGGKYAAGIGGGDSDRGGADGGKVVIKNATVYAEGGPLGAGIGGGEDGEGGDVTIINSTVSAYGGDKGAGIGGGQDSEFGGTLTVESGTVKAYGGYEAAGIGGGEDSCGGTFIANGGTIFAMAGANCATGIGAGHGDYHEGTKNIYPRAKVTSARDRTEAPNNVRPANDRLEGLTWQSVLIEPCNHPAGTDYSDISPEKHTINEGCIYCGLEDNTHEEAHRFDATTHECVCRHKEIPVQLMRDESTLEQSLYKSVGSQYQLPRIQSSGPATLFAGWLVSGVKGIEDGTLMAAGETITTDLSEGSSQITLTARWIKTGLHEHQLTHREAKNPTCTEDGNIEYWVCDQGEHPCGRCFTDGQGKNGIAESAVVIEALGHEWDEPTYTWSSDHKKCVASHTCLRDSSHVETANAIVWGPLTITKATCTEDAGTFYQAVFLFNASFKSQQYYTESTQKATGHDWEEATYTWSDDYSTCTATHICKNNADHEESETVATVADPEEPIVCTDTESKVTFTATFTNEAFGTKMIEVTDPRGHDWGDSRYSWASDNSTCIAVCSCRRNALHFKFESVPTTSEVISPATCTETGEVTYTAKFEDPLFKKQSKTEQINPLGHDWSNWAVTKASTCTDSGEEKRVCARCDAVETRELNAIDHAWGAWVLIKQATDTEEGYYQRVCGNDSSHIETRSIPKTSHQHVFAPAEAIPPTCTEPGVIAHWTCSGDDSCGKYFADAQGETELSEDEITVAPLGHEWGETVCDWSSDYKSCTAWHVCQRAGCLYKEEAVSDTVWAIPKAATCTEDGGIYYFAIFLSHPDFVSQRCFVKTELATGHNWGENNYVWSDDCSTCTATRTCINDSNHVETETVASVVKEATTSSCIVEGEVTYETTFQNTAFGTQTKTVTATNPNGHTWGPVNYVWMKDNVTCFAIRGCENYALHMEFEFAEATPQVIVAPTCTSSGEVLYTADFKNAAFVTQTTTAYPEKLGHDWCEATYEWASDNSKCTASHVCKRDANHTEVEEATAHHTVNKAATCTEGGKETYVAEFAKEGFDLQTKIVETGALGHTPSTTPVISNKVDPTCTEQGSFDALITCGTCGEVIESRHVDLAPLGHDWGDWVQTTDPTCTDPGEKTRTCTHCSATETLEVPATGHKWGQWQFDTSEGVEKRVCEYNSSHVERRSVPEASHVHNNLVEVPAKDPTCTEEGVKQHWKCETEGCGRLFMRLADTDPVAMEAAQLPNGTKLKEVNPEDVVIDPVGHAWTEIERVQDPTCTAAGSQVVKCEHCQETKTEPLQPTGHSAGISSKIALQDVTCIAPGLAWNTVACDKCGQLLSCGFETTSALGHIWGKWTVVGEASETGLYEIKRVCERDPSHTETTYISAMNHVWSEPVYTWSDDFETCTATRTCSHCGICQVETSPSLRWPIRMSTCNEKGTRLYTAAFEEEGFVLQSTRVEDIEPLGHKWGEWVEITPATETSEGLEKHTCSRCNATETRAIPVKVIYHVVEGDGATWEKNSSESLSFTFKRGVADETTFGHFTGIEVDGQVVPAKDESGGANYTVKSGSLILTLQPSYLETLSLGGHTVKAVFDDGSAEAAFTVTQADVVRKASPAQTGDAIPLVAVVSTLLLSALGIAISRKKLNV